MGKTKKDGEPSQTENSTEEKQEPSEEEVFQSIITSKDFKKYITINKAIGEIPEEFDLNKLTEREQLDMIAGFNGWVEAGKPKPGKQQIKKKIEQIQKVYRRKHLGKQKIYYVVKGDPTTHGVKNIPTYGKIEVKGEMVDDKNMIIGWEKQYTIDYTKPKGEELVKRALKESIEPKFFLCQGGTKVAIQNPDNFNKDFDEMMKLHKTGTVI